MFLLITKELTDHIKKKLQSLLNAGIDAYIIVDKGLEKPTKRFITYDKSEMETSGFTNTHLTFPKIMKMLDLKVTGWDKALYHVYKTKTKYAWICEDDVFWNRPAVIKMILDATEKSNDDLIAHPLIEMYESNPKWHHWNQAQMITNNKSKWSSTYNQLCRVSSTLINDVQKVAEKNGHLVFHEALLATVCKMYNLKRSYYTDLKLPIYINVFWKERLTKEEIQTILNENSYVLIHPVKN